jgi:hypothetical protein
LFAVCVCRKSGDSKAKGFISLSSAVISAGGSEKMRRLHGFEIGSTKYTRVFVIHAESEQEMREWINCLQENITYVSQVIEREKKASGGAGTGGGTSGGVGGLSGPGLTLDTDAASMGNSGPFSESHLTAARKGMAIGGGGGRPAPPEQSLSLDVSEEYLKSIVGIPPRLAAWRREQALQAWETTTTTNQVSSATLKRGADSRLPCVGAAAAHNSANMLALGLASTASSGTRTAARGVIQIISLDARPGAAIGPGSTGSSAPVAMLLNEVGRFGDIASAAEADEEDDEDEDEHHEDDEEEEELRSPTSIVANSGLRSTSLKSGVAGAAPPSTLSLPCAGEVSAMAWTDTHLFAGSSAGVVAYYSLPEANASALTSESLKKAGRAPRVLLTHPRSVREVSLAAPGKWTSSSRVAHVSLNAVDKRSVLTLVANSFFVWDLEAAVATLEGNAAGARPSHRIAEVGSPAPLFAAAWNAHSSNEFVCGGEEGALRLLDTRLLAGGGDGGAVADRAKCVPWFLRHAHADVIRDVAWSPLVPHWLASCGDDGLIKVWDLRFGAEPVRTLSGHSNSVLSVAWSRSHCEMLCSGGVDRTSRVWNLRVAPHYALYTHATSSDDLSSSVLLATWGKTNDPFQTMAVSARGEVLALSLGRELMNGYVNHRTLAGPPKEQQQQSPDGSDDALNSTLSGSSGSVDDTSGNSSSLSSAPMVRTAAEEASERSIESLLFARDLERAFRAVAALANSYWAKGASHFAEALLKLTSASLFSSAANEPPRLMTSAPPAGSGGHAHQQLQQQQQQQQSSNNAKVFNALLNDLSRFIPASTLRVSNVDLHTHQRIQFLKTRIALLQLVRAKPLGCRGKEILALCGEICSHLERGGGGAAGPNSPTNASAAGGGAGGGSGAGGAVSPLAGGGAVGSGGADGKGSASGSGANEPIMEQFDALTLEKMAQALLAYDALRALEMLTKLARTCQSAGNFSGLFVGVARAVVSPSVFERMDDASAAARQHSWVRVLSVLAHTNLGGSAALAAAQAQAQAALKDKDESKGGGHGSDSDSDTAESSTNSMSSSVRGGSSMLRKPSDALETSAAAARLALQNRGGASGAVITRPSVAGGAGAGSLPLLGGPRASISGPSGGVGGAHEASHLAQMTLDRDLRNPKTVLQIFALLHAMLSAVAADEDATDAAAGTSSPRARKASGDEGGLARFNPYLPVQDPAVIARAGGALSLDILGLPLLSSSASKEVARIFEEQKDPVKLLPSFAHLLYFHALLSSKKYDLLCVSATRLAAAPHMRGQQLPQVLEGIINEVAAPKLVRFLDRLLAKESGAAAAAGGGKSAAAPVGANLPKLQAASLTIVNMSFNCEYLSEKLGALLPRYLRDCQDSLQRCLNDMLRSPDYVVSTSYASAKQDVKAKAEFILQQMARIRTHSKIVGEPHLTQPVAELTAMLRKFTAE